MTSNGPAAPPPYPYPTYPQPAPPPTVNQSNTTVVVNQPASSSAPNRLVVVEKHQLNARKWNSGICGCLNDFGGCILGTLCLPIMLIKLSNRLHECAFVTCCIPTGYASLRTKLRIMGGIKGSLCDDFLLTSCCGPCAACQMYRELDDMSM